MTILIEALSSVLLVLYVLFEFYRIYIRKNDNSLLLAVFISLLLLIFGFILLIKYGLIIDYGSPRENKISKAEQQMVFAVLNIATALLFLFSTLAKWVLNKLIKRFE